jgi:hypothetical protein
MKASLHKRPPLSLIVEGLPPDGAKLYIGGTEGARNLDLLNGHGITTVVNCAVNLDINYVIDPAAPAELGKCAVGHGAIRYYKLGLVDDFGNPDTLMLAGYYLLLGAVHQHAPDRESYPHRERGNILVHCRGGRSRSVALVALFLHMQMPASFPTLEAAVDHIRSKRELRADEWFETPKPMLFEAANRAAGWIKMIDATNERQPSAA